MVRSLLQFDRGAASPGLFFAGRASYIGGQSER